MNNLSSYYGLVAAKIRTSDKDLPVMIKTTVFQIDIQDVKNMFFETNGTIPFFWKSFWQFPKWTPKIGQKFRPCKVTTL